MRCWKSNKWLSCTPLALFALALLLFCPTSPLCGLITAPSFRPLGRRDGWSCQMAHVHVHQEQWLVLPRRRNHVDKKGKCIPGLLVLPKAACSKGCITAALLALSQPNASSWVIFILSYMISFSVTASFWLNIPWDWFNFLLTTGPSWGLESANEVKKLLQNLEQMREKKHWWQVTYNLKEQEAASLQAALFYL